MSRIEKQVALARAVPGPHPAPLIEIDAWRIGISMQIIDGRELWQLSAALYPPGRNSVEADWNRLGQLVAQAQRASGSIGAADWINEGAPPGAVQHFAWSRNR